MELITKRQVIKEVPARWRKQYPASLYTSGDKYDIWLKLKAEKRLTKKKADTIIGNASWTELECDECGKDVKAVVVLGREESSRSLSVCKSCAKKAVRHLADQMKGGAT